MTQLVLGSTSRYRRDLLDRLGLDYLAVSHLVDEDEYKWDGRDAAELAGTLSVAKAQSLRSAYPDAYILGSDQVAVLGAEILSKPVTVERACAQLAALSGRTHRLITGIALATPDGEVWTEVDEHRMTMRALQGDEIARYVAADQPLDCCGSYRIESRGMMLFEAIEGSDYTAIVGLGLIKVTSLLRRAGFQLP